MGFFRDNEGKAGKVIRRYMRELPALGHELRNTFEELRSAGLSVDFSEGSLKVLERIVNGAGLGEKIAVGKPSGSQSFMLRNRHVIGRVGVFLGCLVIENLGGQWEREDGGLLVTGIGTNNTVFDPFEATIKAIIEPKRQSLLSQFKMLKEEIKGTGPRVRFREKVVKAIQQRLPEAKVGRVCGLDVWLTNGTKIHLGNLYATCQRTPETQDEAIGAFADVASSFESEGAQMPGFKDACGKLYPVLKNGAFMERGAGGNGTLADELLWEEFHCGLVVCFIFETDGCFRFVRKEDVLKWGASREEVRSYALRNLEKSSSSLEHDFAQTRYGKAVVVNTNDGYDAARILLPNIRDIFSRHLGKSFIVAVPCRDLLVAFEDREDLLCFMRRWIRDDAHLGAYGLTDALFICDERGIQPLVIR